jgi:hypothetical protein
MAVPWAKEGSGFTLLFEALALSLAQELPVAQTARQMRVGSKRLWRRLAHYVGLARAQDDMHDVTHVGIDETSVKRGCVFRSNWTLIPRQTGHPFHGKLITQTLRN